MTDVQALGVVPCKPVLLIVPQQYASCRLVSCAVDTHPRHLTAVAINQKKQRCTWRANEI